MSPRRLLPLLAALVVAALGGAACTSGNDAVDPNAGGEYRFVAGDGSGKLIAAADRKPAPAFTGSYLDGSPFQSKDLAGKVTVINFWGSWCGPCRVETPAFQQVYAETKDSGVEFLGVNVKDSEQGANAFIENKKITYKSLFDPDGRVALAFRGFPPNSIPSTIVLDRQGRVAEVHLGIMLAGDIQPVVEQLAAES